MNNLINYNANVVGTLNGEDIFVTGTGTIINGICNGSYKLINLPENVDPEILKIVMITGYPSACSSINNQRNVFGNKSYTYSRDVQFSNGGNFSIEVECNRYENKLQSTFKINGQVNPVELSYAEPLVEIWEPQENNILTGKFCMFWKTKDGNYFSGTADSIYRPAHNVANSPICHRYIETSSKFDSTKKTLDLYQKSFLFHKIDQIK